MAAPQAGRAFLGLGSRVPNAPAGAKHSQGTLFFREVCRTIPWVVEKFKLEELTTPAAVRRTVNAMFRENAKVADPKAINMLIYKGREELEMVLMQHKQRHHLIDKYVKRPAHKVPTPYDAATSSEFMQKFLA